MPSSGMLHHVALVRTDVALPSLGWQESVS
jgi:hypothetical protein